MSKQSQYPKVNLLGVEVDALTMPQAIAFILDRAANPATPASYVVKPYVEFLDRAAGDPAVRQLLMDAELSLADGVALPWAATYLYGGRRNLWRLGQTLSWIALAPGRLSAQLPERASGINLAWPLLQAAAERHLSVFLIGSPAASTIKHTASTLAAAIPDLRIAGTQNGAATAPGGSLSAGWLDATATAIRSSKPDLILVGLGFPLQERVMAALQPHLAHGVMIGEGGTFDYEQFGGRRPKAPVAFQRLGLEWLWRLMLEPSRYRRQLAIPRFIWRVWRWRDH